MEPTKQQSEADFEARYLNTEPVSGDEASIEGGSQTNAGEHNNDLGEQLAAIRSELVELGNRASDLKVSPEAVRSLRVKQLRTLVEGLEVEHETGLSPRQLAEQRRGLVEALKRLMHCYETSLAGKSVRDADEALCQAHTALAHAKAQGGAK